MGILVESATSSPSKTSESPTGKKFYEFPSMNQYQCPPKSPREATQMAAVSEAVQQSQHQSFYNSEIKPESWPPPSSASAVAAAPHPNAVSGLSSNSLESDVTPPLCAGCQLRIEDKFYLTAVDVKWHSACLKCAECGVELETQSSCFERDGNIYCKEDYRRIYNPNKCARCLGEIHSSDLVMKARQFLFHVNCFRCDTCGIVLQKGDLFGMHEDSLYCDVHYGLHSGSGVAGTHDLMPPGPLTPGGPVGPPFVPDPMGHSPNYLNFPPIPGGFPGGPPPCSDPTSNAGNGGWYPPASASDFPPGLGGPGGDFQYDNNNVNDPIMKKRRGRKKRKVETFAAMNGYLEAAGGYPPGMDGQGGPGKTKRARTSFKHHQLRIMKHHFNINQNPDSRELKILSQKTGLDKKVLQVWFQNARAKWRRTRAQESHSNPSGSTQGAGAGNLGTDEGDLLGSPSSDCSGTMIPVC